MQSSEVVWVNNCHFFPLFNTKAKQAVSHEEKDINMTKEIDFYGSQHPFVGYNSCKYCKRGVFANTKLNLYANVHIIMEMHNATFSFAGSFVESQNTNVMCLLHMQDKGNLFPAAMRRCSEAFYWHVVNKSFK